MGRLVFRLDLLDILVSRQAVVLLAVITFPRVRQKTLVILAGPATIGALSLFASLPHRRLTNVFQTDKRLS